MQNVSKENAHIIAQQQLCISRIDRIIHGMDVLLYYLNASAQNMPLLKTKKIDVWLATLHLICKETGHQAKAKVHVVRGKVFSIDYNTPPGDLYGEKLEISIQVNKDFK